MPKKSPIGDVIIELTDIDSTNNYAMRLLNEGMAEHGLVVRADFQTAGKGQLGNTWLAEESKNLLMSVILDTSELAIEKQFYLNAAICTCVADTLMTHYDLRHVTVKWPNDIYAGNLKIAGILIENNIRGTVWTNTVVGIGINVNQMRFPDLTTATSIRLETGKSHKVNHLMRQLNKNLNGYLEKLEQNPDALFEVYNQLLMNVGKSIHYKRNFELESGTLLGVNAQGLLEVDVKGKLKMFKHKEIEWILGSG